MKLTFGTFLILATLAMPAIADQQDIEFQTFHNLLDRGQYQLAIKVAEKSIENGSTRAELHHSLAKIYNNGIFETTRDEDKAAFYFERAIQLGDSLAAIEYGNALINGEGFPQDCDAGIAYLHFAHENEVTTASALLGSKYLSGHCVPQNFALGKEYLSAPLELENAAALNSMATAYFFGNGTDINLSKAFNFFTRSAKQGNCNGAYHLGAMYDNGIFVDVDLQKAFNIFEKSHTEGCVQSTVGLANMYYLARHVPENNEKAFALYEQASQSGDLESLAVMATMLIDGLGVKEDKKRGFELLHKAAERDDDESQYHLANYYFDGIFVEQNYEKAAKYYQASLSNPFSQFGLGYLYEFGLGVHQNFEIAEQYYLGSFRQGNTQGIMALARWYINGNYYIKDHSAALKLLEQGAATRDDENIALLAMLLSCSTNNNIQDPKKALSLISEQKKWKDNAHVYEVDLAEAIVMGSLGKFAKARDIIDEIEHFYSNPKYQQQHLRNWHARDRFASFKVELESFQSCSW
jgi:TPR repeat protein